VATHAKKSIANFKLRQGQKIGMKVTLRGTRMYEFLDRLINVVLPTVRDFHGVALKAFDTSGNYSIGFADQSIFPELGFSDLTVLHGLQVVIVTSTVNREHAYELLKALGMPFEKENK
jgi:large subunit ribosomal protein L5